MDEHEHEHGNAPAPEHSCGNPDCPVGGFFNSNVRAVEVDGERYLNAMDLVQHLKSGMEFQTASVYHAAQASGMFEEEGLEDAVKHSIFQSMQGAEFCLQIVAEMDERPITPLEDRTSPLVTPEALKMDQDTVPNEWVQHTE